MASKWQNAELWKNWERQGRQEFMKQCHLLVDGSDVSPILASSSKGKALTRVVYELIWHGIKGPLRRESTANAMGELSAMHHDLPSIIVDVINVVDTETLCNESRTEDRERFCSIVKEAEKYLSEPLLKERLEIDFLQDVGILKNKKSFHTKFIKVKTKLFYKQQKFNLFREESEGYAKLVAELNQDPDPALGPNHILEVIKSLIGCFNLDPNRVLDVVLESFECHPERHPFFVPLLRAYMPDPHTLCEVLGFKFSLHRDGTTPTPSSLYTTAALLLQNGVIGLDDIYGWLVPDDKAIQREADKDLKEAREYARRVNVVSTKDSGNNGVNASSTVSSSSSAAAADGSGETPLERYRQNQKLGMCEALLWIGDWKNARALTARLPDFFAVSHPPISRALCHLVHAVIERVYRKNSGLSQRLKGHVVTPPSSPLAPKAAETLESLKDDAFPMLLALGPHLHQDPILFYKVLRLCKAVIKEGPPEMSYNVLTLLDETVLPSLSLMDANCCAAEEVWQVLRLYPYQHRYHLYGRWKNEGWQPHPRLTRKKADASKRIKFLMKRVSKENVKPIGRLIGKLTHSSPGTLFDYILSQVQLYDNLISPVVDSLKYLTSLSYDVLAFCVVEALAHPDKERTKHDGTTISLWLQSLSAFCGAVFKKYNIELTGLLQYVANQLRAKKSLDLLILKEIVQKMAGIEAAEEMTADQLEAMAGGELLKSEAGYFSQVRNTKKSSQRLKDALAENDLALALCLLTAQQRNCVVYQETESSHLKLVGKLYDQCQDALVQFGTFLANNWGMDDYSRRVPPVSELLSDYFIHADVAFFLARPMFTNSINSKFDELRRADKGHKSMTSAQKQHKYVEAVEQVMTPVVESVRPLHPPKIWEDISPQFYVTFWALTMYDLGVPSDAYTKEVQRIKHASLQVAENKDLVASKRKREQERCQALMEKLQEEERKQREHVERVMARLRQERSSWFLSRSAKSAKNETVTQFLQLCLFPRCIFTATDAVYCAKFVHTVHSLKTPNFSTLICYDRIFCDITYTVTSCTENEANRYGRFLCAMLETVMRWHSDKAIFEKECANYPGFVTKFRVSNQASEANDHVDYENYRHVCHKWHYKIAKALVVCLESKDYVQIRNSIAILIKILPHFPVISSLGQVLEKRIEKVRQEEKDKRQDLYVLATSYNGQLKHKKAAMIPEDKFHHVTRKAGGGGGNTSGGNGAGGNNASSGGSKLSNGDLNNVKLEVTPGSGSLGLNHASGKDADKDKSEAKDKEKKNGSTSNSPAVGSGRGAGGTESSVKSGGSTVVDGVKIREVSSTKDKLEKERISLTRGGGGGNGDSDAKSKKEEAAEKRLKEKREERQRLREEKMLRAEERLIQKQEDREREREASEVSTGSGGSDLRRRSQEPPEFDRDIKRRKLEQAGSSKNDDLKRTRGDARDLDLSLDAEADRLAAEKAERKEKRAKSKEKLREEKKEKKLERKRERLEESPTSLELKRKKEEERMNFARHMPMHANGEPPEHRDKHHYVREKSPSLHYREKERQRERDRSHDRADLREKHSKKRRRRKRKEAVMSSRMSSGSNRPGSRH